nr:hypothetical protein [Tanacetum cinerariifolium]
MKSLKEKVEDRLFKQDQYLQTVHMLCRPKPYYNELNKVAIGYKNPLCLTRAKQVHPALYNGHEIIKDNHVSAIVHNTKDTLEIAQITRRKMNDKMKDPECVTQKVKIAPHDYSKENFLATFTPQTQLTLEQIFWSQDLIKLKSKALKEQTTVSRPIKALTVYPPNTSATLVPRVLPTKSQVKIHIYTLIQLFLEFDKTCKKRITPTGVTEGKGVLKLPLRKPLVSFLDMLSLGTNQGMLSQRDVFEELEAEVALNVVDRKHDAIERKDLLIANDNLVAECLSKEVFSVATNSELNVARFTKMHVANTIVEARCLELEAELSNLRDKSHHDNLEELVNHFSKHEPHDPDFVPEPIYPEYIPLEDDHILSAEEQPLPHVVSPTAESPGYVAESDPEEDPEEYEDDETEDGPVDYPMDGGDDGDDDDGDSSGYDANDEDEEEEEHLAPADFTVVIPTDELISPLEGTEPVIPPPSTDTATTGARITVRLQSFHQRCTAPTALPSPPLPPPLHMPPPIDRRDDIPETEMPPCKRLCLSTLGSRYEVGESSTARPTDSRGIDYGFASTLDAEARRRRIREVGYELVEPHEHDTHELYALLEDAQDSSTRISQRVDVDSQQVDLLMEDMIAHQETIQIVEDEAYATREAWAHLI